MIDNFPEEWTEEVAKETGLSFDDWCSLQVLRFANKAEEDPKKDQSFENVCTNL